MASERKVLPPFQLLCWVLSLLILVPLVLVTLNSLKPPAESAFFSLALPSEFIWANYANAFIGGNMLRSSVNSLIMATFSTLLSNITAPLAAFVLVRSVSRLNRLLHIYFFFGVVAMSNMVSTTYVMSALNLTNSIFGMILLNGAQGIAFSMLLFVGFIKVLPRELDEAAAMDGAVGWRAFFTVIFPLLKPVIMTGMVLNFMGSWNDFQTQIYVLTDSSNWGVMLSMFSVYGQFSSPWATDWGIISAYIVMSIIPVLLIYAFGQRYIIEGMTMGAVKG